jgi:hypothetical protein
MTEQSFSISENSFLSLKLNRVSTQKLLALFLFIISPKLKKSKQAA